MRMKKHVFKEPQIPPELLLFHSLHVRQRLSPEEKNAYYNLRKGYEGERKFFNILDKSLPSVRLNLNSLLLQHNKTQFQLDSVLIW